MIAAALMVLVGPGPIRDAALALVTDLLLHDREVSAVATVTLLRLAEILAPAAAVSTLNRLPILLSVPAVVVADPLVVRLAVAPVVAEPRLENDNIQVAETEAAGQPVVVGFRDCRCAGDMSTLGRGREVVTEDDICRQEDIDLGALPRLEVSWEGICTAATTLPGISGAWRMALLFGNRRKASRDECIPTIAVSVGRRSVVPSHAKCSHV